MKKKIVLVVAVLMVVMLVFAGCKPAQEEPASDADAAAAAAALDEASGDQDLAAVEDVEMTAADDAQAVTGGEEAPPLKDLQGNDVEIGQVEKVVSLTPAGTEIIYALGAQDKLVGVDAFSNYPEEAQSLETVGDFNGPDVEKVVSLEPDVVLTGTKLQQDAIDKLNEMGINVVSIEATTFDQIPESVLLIGEIVGEPEAAATLVGEIESAVQTAKDSAPDEAKTVYYAMSYGEAGNWTANTGTFINEMIELAGGTPALNDESLPPWVDFPVEDLVAANPDIVLTDASMGAVSDITQENGYKDLDAIKNGTYYEINADIFTRPGPRVMDALAELTKILNGEA